MGIAHKIATAASALGGKGAAALTATVLALALAVGGTFAWSNMGQNATNEMVGGPTVGEGVLVVEKHVAEQGVSVPDGDVARVFNFNVTFSVDGLSGGGDGGAADGGSGSGGDGGAGGEAPTLDNVEWQVVDGDGAVQRSGKLSDATDPWPWQLADGWYLNFQNVPTGATFKVEEQASDGFETTVRLNNGPSRVAAVQEGKLRSDGDTVSFTNTYAQGELDVEKQVKRPSGGLQDDDYTAIYTFEVTFDDGRVRPFRTVNTDEAAKKKREELGVSGVALSALSLSDVAGSAEAGVGGAGDSGVSEGAGAGAGGAGDADGAGGIGGAGVHGAQAFEGGSSQAAGDSGASQTSGGAGEASVGDGASDAAADGSQQDAAMQGGRMSQGFVQEGSGATVPGSSEVGAKDASQLGRSADEPSGSGMFAQEVVDMAEPGSGADAEAAGAGADDAHASGKKSSKSSDGVVTFHEDAPPILVATLVLDDGATDGGGSADGASGPDGAPGLDAAPEPLAADTVIVELMCGQTAVFEGLPEGLGYTVREVVPEERDTNGDGEIGPDEKAGFVPETDKYSGKIDKSSVVKALFVNMLDPLPGEGGFLVGKDVSRAEGELADEHKSEPFRFLVSVPADVWKVGDNPATVPSAGSTVSLDYRLVEDGAAVDSTDDLKLGWAASRGDLDGDPAYSPEYVDRLKSEHGPTNTLDFVVGDDGRAEGELVLRHGQRAVFWGIPHNSKVAAVEKLDDRQTGLYEATVGSESGYAVTDELVPLSLKNTVVEQNVDVSGEKTWVLEDWDVPDTAVMRGVYSKAEDFAPPEFITVNVKDASGEVVATQEVREGPDGRWTYSFSLPKWDEGGNVVEYSVEEEPVRHFSVSYDGYDIKNTQEIPIEPTAVELPSVAKHVVGEDAPDGAVFTFVLSGKNGAPMPAGSVDGKLSINMFGAGDKALGMVNVSAAGTYSYEVRESALGAEGWSYDSVVCTFDIVVEQRAGQLFPKVVVTSPGTVPSMLGEVYRSSVTGGMSGKGTDGGGAGAGGGAADAAGAGGAGDGGSGAADGESEVHGAFGGSGDVATDSEADGPIDVGGAEDSVNLHDGMLHFTNVYAEPDVPPHGSGGGNGGGDDPGNNGSGGNGNGSGAGSGSGGGDDPASKLVRALSGLGQTGDEMPLAVLALVLTLVAAVIACAAIYRSGKLHAPSGGEQREKTPSLKDGLQAEPLEDKRQSDSLNDETH